jgi:hypothetical protein
MKSSMSLCSLLPHGVVLRTRAFKEQWKFNETVTTAVVMYSYFTKSSLQANLYKVVIIKVATALSYDWINVVFTRYSTAHFIHNSSNIRLLIQFYRILNTHFENFVGWLIFSVKYNAVIPIEAQTLAYILTASQNYCHLEQLSSTTWGTHYFWTLYKYLS